MKNKQNDKTNQKRVVASSKKAIDTNNRIIKNNRLDTDVLGMQEGIGESRAKTGKNNLKKRNF